MDQLAITPLDILLHARSILSKQGAWMKGGLAKNMRGESVPPEHESAVCFCALGSLWRAAYTVAPGTDITWRRNMVTEAQKILNYRAENLKLKGELPGGPWGYFALEMWNDHKARVKNHVITLFDSAIEQTTSGDALRPFSMKQ